MSAHRQPTACDSSHLESRVVVLEREVQQLRSALSKNRRMLKQAIMLQMDADDEDDAFLTHRCISSASLGLDPTL